MAKIISKAAVCKQDIAASLTAIAQIESFGSSGAESETVKVSTLDTTGSGHEYLATGWSEGGSFDMTLQYDSELAGHQSLTDDVTTPAERDYSVTLLGGTEMTFTAAGIGFGFQGTIDDVIKGDVTLKLDQLIALHNMKAKFINDAEASRKADPELATLIKEDGKRYFPAGTVVEDPRAYRLVQLGVAEPADPECVVAAGMTTEAMKRAQLQQEMVAKGIQQQDYQRYLDGEILGYDEEGNDIPGPHWVDDEEPEEPDYEMEDVD